MGGSDSVEGRGTDDEGCVLFGDLRGGEVGDEGGDGVGPGLARGDALLLAVPRPVAVHVQLCGHPLSIYPLSI